MNENTCIICLSSDIRIINITNTYLQEVYEKLTDIKLSNHYRSLCYICYTRLKQCCSLMKKAKISHDILQAVLDTNFESTSDIDTPHSPLLKLSSETVVNISIDSALISLNVISESVKHESLPSDDEVENLEDSIKQSDSEDDVPLKKVSSKSGTENKLEKRVRKRDRRKERNDDNETSFKHDIKLSDSEDDKPLKVNVKKETDSDVCNGSVKKRKRDKKQDAEELDARQVVLSSEEQLAELRQRASSTNYLYAPYKCALCFKGFVSPSAFGKHREKHDQSSGDYECSVCRLRYSSARLLRAHAVPAHVRRYDCGRCGHRAHTRNQAKDHQRWHKGHTYPCQLCGLKFSKPTTYLTHLRKLHSSDNVCEKCGESFVGTHGLLLHLSKSHKKDEQTPDVPLEPASARSCGECNIQFQTSTAWKRHMLTSVKHAANENDPSCKICGVSVSPGARAAHMRLHAVDLRPKAEAAPPVTARLPCDQCEGVFSSRSRLQAHVKRVHLGLKYNKNIVCETCGKKCTSNATLKYHQRRHTGERPYACALCPARFADSNQLRIHARVHSGERPYACALCTKRFSQKPALNKHYRVHTGAKPYECQLCNKNFSQSNSLKLHVRTVHLKLPPNNKKNRAQIPKPDEIKT